MGKVKPIPDHMLSDTIKTNRFMWATVYSGIKKKPRLETNKEFARNDPEFKSACTRAGVEPTRRQASNYRNGKGRAYGAR